MRETREFETEMKWMGKIGKKIDYRPEGIFGVAKGDANGKTRGYLSSPAFFHTKSELLSFVLVHH